MAGFSHNPNDVTPNMTSNTDPSPYVAAASSQYSGTYPAYKAFDGSASSTNAWVSTNSGSPWWVSLDFGSALYAIAAYSITIYNNTNEGPKNFKFQGSNNGTDWVDLDTRTNITWSSTYEMKEFAFANTTGYRYYRLYVSAVASGNYCSIYEIEMIPSAEPELHLEDMAFNLSAYFQILGDLASFLQAHDGLEYRDIQAALQAGGWTSEDLATLLSALLQELVDTGLELSTIATHVDDLKSVFAAYFAPFEQDMRTLLETWATQYDDLPAALYAVKTVYKDLKAWLATNGQSLSSLVGIFQAAAEKRRDLLSILYATDGIVIKDFRALFVATDGMVKKDIALYLRAIAGIPAFRTITAHKVSAVVHEVT